MEASKEGKVPEVCFEKAISLLAATSCTSASTPGQNKGCRPACTRAAHRPPACLPAERLAAPPPPPPVHMQAPTAGAHPHAKPAGAGRREEGEVHVVAPADTRCHEDTGTPGTEATPGSNPETVEGREAWRD